MRQKFSSEWLAKTRLRFANTIADSHFATHQILKSSTRCNSSHTYKKYMYTLDSTYRVCACDEPRIRILIIGVYLLLCLYVLNETLKCCWRTWMKTAREGEDIAVRAMNKYGTPKKHDFFSLIPSRFVFNAFFPLFGILLRIQFRPRCAQPFQ